MGAPPSPGFFIWYTSQNPSFFHFYLVYLIKSDIGRGIAGQTTYQLLVHFREDIVELAPAAVVINGGTNDIAENNYAYNEDRTFGNIASMAEIASANGIKVIRASVLPASGFNWNTSISGVADKIASLNARIKAYAESKSYPYIDYYPALVSGSDRALNPAYTNDGVHPTAAGYDIMESIALPVIRSVVKLDANLPESASISGAALAEGETVGLHRRGIGSFEAYTKLRGGETFTIEADGKKYGRTDGYMTEGGTISVDKTGVYRVRANFVSRTVSLNGDKYTHTQADADIASGVAEVAVDTAGEYEYFSVQGVRLASRPESGIYISAVKTAYPKK